MIYDIPNDLEALAIARQDSLREAGELFYHPGTTTHITTPNSEYHYVLHTTPALKSKPLLAADAPGRSLPTGPFVDPDPRFVLTPAGPGHTLILSKYCATRPHLVLHTNKFQLQSDDLSFEDWAATWAVMMSLERDSVVVYNCGFEGGSSQGHKHLQILPNPGEGVFRQFEDETLVGSIAVTTDCLPCLHWIVHLDLEGKDPVQQIVGRYMDLLALTKKALRTSGRVTTQEAEEAEDATSGSGVGGYNVIATRRWLCLVPRRHNNMRGLGANGVGMLGWLWFGSEEERQTWVQLGIERVLAYLGLPRE